MRHAHLAQSQLEARRVGEEQWLAGQLDDRLPAVLGAQQVARVDHAEHFIGRVADDEQAAAAARQDRGTGLGDGGRTGDRDDVGARGHYVVDSLFAKIEDVGDALAPAGRQGRDLGDLQDRLVRLVV